MNKNDRVAATRFIRATELDTYYGRGRDIAEGTLGTVTSVKGISYVHVRFEGQPRVLKVEVSELTLVADPEYAAKVAEKEAEKAREAALLEPQEGDILPDDPRLAWLWRKTTAYAEKQGYCPTYDAICDELGLPGRPRDFVVNFKLGGLSLSTTVKAVNQANAIEKVATEAPEATFIEALTRR